MVRNSLFPVAPIVVLVGAVALSGSVALAQDAPQRGGSLDLVALNDLATLDNIQAVQPTDYNMVAGALYEGLYHFTPDGELEAGLADGLPEISPDGLVYTIKIKDGAMFAGRDFEPREVSAADVVYGFTRGLDPTPNGAPAQSWGAGYLFPIEGAQAVANGEAEEIAGVEIIDNKTIRITLAQPSVTFVYGLTVATSWPVPAEAVEARGEEFGNRPVGAGPFFIKEWNKGSHITIARNPGYADAGLPYLDEIRVDLAVDENTQVLRIESGQADGVFELFSISPAAIRLLQQNENITVSEGTSPRIFYLGLNNDSIFGDKNLRQAVAHALTKKFTRQFGGTVKPWNQLQGSATKQNDSGRTRVYEHDPDAARALVEASGYDGTPIRIVHDVADPFQGGLVTSLKQDLEAVGFTVDLQTLATDEFYGAIYDPEAFDISPIFWSADYPDLQDYLSTNFTCDLVGILNIARFCNKDIDAEFYATEQMAFGPERDATLLAVQQRLIDELAGIPVMEVTPQVVQGPKVGAMPTLTSYAPFDWKRAWVRSGD